MKNLENYIKEGLFSHDTKKEWAQETLLHELNKYHDKWSIDNDKKQLILKCKIGSDLYFHDCEFIKKCLDDCYCDTFVIDSNNINSSIGLDFPKFIDYENKTIMPYDSTRIGPTRKMSDSDQYGTITIKNLNFKIYYMYRGDTLSFNVFASHGGTKLINCNIDVSRIINWYSPGFYIPETENCSISAKSLQIIIEKKYVDSTAKEIGVDLDKFGDYNSSILQINTEHIINNVVGLKSNEWKQLKKIDIQFNYNRHYYVLKFVGRAHGFKFKEFKLYK